MLSKATEEVLYIKIYSGLKYILLKLFWNFWNLTVPDPELSHLALSWLQLFMSTVASSMSFGFHGYCQQCIICFHSCVHGSMQYFVIFDCTLLENKLTATTTIDHRPLLRLLLPHQLCFLGRRQRHSRCYWMQAFSSTEVQQFHLIQETQKNGHLLE